MFQTSTNSRELKVSLFFVQTDDIRNNPLKLPSPRLLMRNGNLIAT
jgi:hypothetical protein